MKGSAWVVLEKTDLVNYKNRHHPLSQQYLDHHFQHKSKGFLSNTFWLVN